MICSLRKLKYLLTRSVLNKIYVIFIRPHLEYACEVWDGCAQYQVDRLEQLQLEAARIVTGLPKYTHHEYLYYETGWETLAERRRKRKLCLFYKIHNNMAPLYLHDLIPGKVSSKSSYFLRNSNNVSLPLSRLKLVQDSYFPSTIRMWNEVPLGVRKSRSLSSFKFNITVNNKTAPQYFDYGPRHTNIILTKLRYMCSQLNYDLFRVGIVENPSCSCGNKCENNYHYLFECHLYAAHRTVMMSSIRSITDMHINCDLLLHGNADLKVHENQQIFKLVQTYICQSKRFF